jgi:alpha-beta hydrolase superfamily lysophospholipase
MSWMAAHPWLTSAYCLLGVFLLLNVLAYRHARAMTHILPAGGWRRKPEMLTRLEKVRVLLSGVQICRPLLEDQPEKWGLAAETHTFPGAIADLEAWYMPHPAPAGVVVLFHGYIACKARLLPEAKAFHDLGYACFLVDFPGCGGSGGSTTTIGYRESEDVRLAVEYVHHTWPTVPVTIFGQSMGAAAVLRSLAFHHLDLECAILEAPFDRLLNTVRARFAMMRIPSFLAAELLVLWGGLMLGYNGFRHNPVTYARRVRCPVLMMHGRDDRKVSCAQAMSVYNALAGEKQIHFFDNVGHESYAANCPEEWKAQVGAFLHTRILAH